MARLTSSHRALVLGVLAVAAFVAGCSGRGAPPPNVQLNIEQIAYWYQLYRSRHNRQPPPNEEAFVSFIKKTMTEEQNIPMHDDFLVSPRDGKKYTIRYGKPMSDNPERNIIAYEQEGGDGKKWLVVEMGYGKEVEDAELQQLLAGK
jgi:hypothetical protein